MRNHITKEQSEEIRQILPKVNVSPVSQKQPSPIEYGTDEWCRLAQEQIDWLNSEMLQEKARANRNKYVIYWLLVIIGLILIYVESHYGPQHRDEYP